jgi:hypothetical protein
VDDSTLNQGKECPPQATRAALKPWRATAHKSSTVHITLTLYESHDQLPVGTSKKRPPGDRQRVHRCDITQGTKVPHDGPARVPVCLDAGRNKGVTGVQMPRMRPVLVPVTQIGSSAARLGGSGNVGRAARMDNGDIQQFGTVGRGKGHFNADPSPLTAHSCNPNGIVLGLRTRTTAGTGADAADSFLPVSVWTRAAPTQAIATHGAVYIDALDVRPTKASGGRDMRVGASSAKAKVVTVDELVIGEAEIRVDRDGAQVRPCVPVLET